MESKSTQTIISFLFPRGKGSSFLTELFVSTCKLCAREQKHSAQQLGCGTVQMNLLFLLESKAQPSPRLCCELDLSGWFCLPGIVTITESTRLSTSCLTIPPNPCMTPVGWTEVPSTSERNTEGARLHAIGQGHTAAELGFKPTQPSPECPFSVPTLP